MLYSPSNLMEVGSCCEAALTIDRAVPKPSSSKHDARLCDKRTLGVRPLKTLGNKGYADILQLSSHSHHFHFFGFTLIWLRSDLELPSAVTVPAAPPGRHSSQSSVRTHSSGLLMGSFGAEIDFFQQFRRVSLPLLFSVTYVGCITGLLLSKRCLILPAHVVPDCWEDAYWDQSTC